MKRILLFIVILFVSGVSNFAVSQQQVLSVKIVKTGNEGGVDVSYDDGEFENDAIDNFYDDDLDMGWEGEDLNIMTTFLRFQNISIPYGATIDSAFLNLYAHEDEADEARVTIFAHDADNSPAFVETELLNDRAFTQASVRGVITEPWTSGSLTDHQILNQLLQANVNRSGWNAGKRNYLYFKGKNRVPACLPMPAIRSFENIEDPEDGGDGLLILKRIPELKIYYTLNISILSTNH